ncbi:MAG: hypothetical protein QOF02_3673 [Blastocatellia bacterium]|jgi:hypothetical protein|nr:hypothetical protein [Blastocatellia bacterium]
MSAEQFTTFEEVDEHFLTSTAAAPPDPELARLEALIDQCWQLINQHMDALRYLWPQHDELEEALRIGRLRRQLAQLEALRQPVTFYSIEEAASL